MFPEPIGSRRSSAARAARRDRCGVDELSNSEECVVEVECVVETDIDRRILSSGGVQTWT